MPGNTDERRVKNKKNKIKEEPINAVLDHAHIAAMAFANPPMQLRRSI
jgi:hypothetical protein